MNIFFKHRTMPGFMAHETEAILLFRVRTKALVTSLREAFVKLKIRGKSLRARPEFVEGKQSPHQDNNAYH